MTFMESVRTCLKENYCNFEGRAPRSEYWWFTLFGVLLGIVTSVLDGFLGTYTVTSSGETIGFINLIFLLAMLLPSIAVAVRRLHDTDRSGWRRSVVTCKQRLDFLNRSFCASIASRIT